MRFQEVRQTYSTRSRMRLHFVVMALEGDREGHRVEVSPNTFAATWLLDPRAPKEVPLFRRNRKRRCQHLLWRRRTGAANTENRKKIGRSKTLKTVFWFKKDVVKAIDDISFDISRKRKTYSISLNSDRVQENRQRLDVPYFVYKPADGGILLRRKDIASRKRKRIARVS